MKKTSKWERNLNTVKRARERALKKVNELESQGLYIPEGTRKKLYEPLKKRYSEKETKALYQSIWNTRSIAKTVKMLNKDVTYKTLYMDPFKRQTGISQQAKDRQQKIQYREPIKVRVGNEGRDIGEQVFEHMRYAMQKHPSQDSALAVTFLMQKLGVAKVNFKKVGEAFDNGRIDKEKFIEEFSKLYDTNEAKAMNYINYFYKQGRSSENAYNSFMEQSKIQSMSNFGKTYQNMKDKDVELLYDFFENNPVWQQFKANFDPSDYADDTGENNKLFDAIVDNIKAGATKQEINNILINGDYTKLEEMLKEKLKQN